MHSFTAERTTVHLRHWRDEDLPVFAALNADPQVMAHFPAPLSRSDSDALAARLRAGLAGRGWGAWVLARRDDDALLGCVGLNPVAASFPVCAGGGNAVAAGSAGQGGKYWPMGRATGAGYGARIGHVAHGGVHRAGQSARALMARVGYAGTGRI